MGGIVESTGRGRAARYDDVFVGDSAMAERMRTTDWARTSLGPVSSWSQSLRSIIRVLLTSRFQMWLAWGDELAFLYNDAYRPTLGAKEPIALGAPAAKLWAEIWADIGPRISSVMSSGVATWDEGLRLLLERSGYAEETFHTFSYSPIYDDDGAIRGLLSVVTEETERVIGERRTATLRELASALAATKATSDVFASVARAIEANRADLPFAAAYVVDDAGLVARRAFAVGVDDKTAADTAPLIVARDDVASPVTRALADNTTVIVERPADVRWPTGPWSRQPTRLVVLPLGWQPAHASGALVFGINPHRQLDENFKGFLSLFAGQVSAALASAHAFDEEKKRADALAALDRAKTAFFSNVSHELRTPLTLILGPVEGALAEGRTLAGEELATTYRNAHRLQRLVNSLLDFSRIEAGRVEATYRPVDLARLTRDLAGTFRAALERAGIAFDVELAPLDEPVWIDESMWEKIVLNLLSNAFKFTLQGSIRVSLVKRRNEVELCVTDTGVGIPAQEVPRVFERFHRVEDARGRTQEGSGIGLALVAELARLHGGTVSCESTLGEGSRFFVRVPLGYAHLPKDRVDVEGRTRSSTSSQASHEAEAVIAEVMRWLPTTNHGVSSVNDDVAEAVDPTKRARILLADDNADMRDYLRRLLEEHWHVEAVADGEAALAAARRARPDLIVTDVMMPNLDGFGLLRAVRDDADLKRVPVVMLSARAGEEARVEGLDAGAADYIVKPFTARELIARVRARLEVSILERALEGERERLSALFQNAPAFICILAGKEHVFEMANPPYRALIGGRDVVGKPLREALPEVEGQGYVEMLNEVMRSRQAIMKRASRVLLERDGKLDEVYVDFVYQPRFDVEGRVDGVLVFGFEVTEQVLAKQAIERESKQKDEFLAMLAHELRNPLAPVRAAVHLARNTQDDGKRRRHLDIIERQTNNLARIVDDLLDVSRITRGLIELRKELVEVDAVVRRAVEATTPLIEARRHHIAVASPQGALFVCGDVVRLEQVLVNLLSNAAKYTDAGGHITVTVEADANNVVVRVKDDGIGIPAETLPRIFDLFQQAERGLDRAEGGLGIGLTVVKNLVEMHGGTITAHSDGRGCGSELTVRLPRATPPVATEAVPAKAGAAAVRRVLVVDDNRDAADLLGELIECDGHEVFVAYDGLEALRAVEAHRPTHVFLDIGLPGLNGYDVVRRLRAERRHDDLRIIAVTGYGQPDDRRRTREAGFDDHVVKPVTSEALARALASTS